jgi:hypothetical protein
MVVILSDLSASFTLSPSLDKDVYNISGMPYFPPKDTPKEKEAFEKLTCFYYDRIYEAANSGCSILYIGFTPLTGQVLQELRMTSDYPNAGEWPVFSFFHDDDELLATKIKVTSVEYLNPYILLDMKNQYLASVANYPFIKSYKIPYGFEITFEFIEKLLQEQ